MPDFDSLSSDGKLLLQLIEDAISSCAWVSWSTTSKKHRQNLTTTEALKIKNLLRGNKLQVLQDEHLSHALVEVCSFETPEQTDLRVKNVNITTAPFDSFGSLIDMLRCFAESKEEGRKPSPEELTQIYLLLEFLTKSLAEALMIAWESKESDAVAQKEKERKISVILQHLTCHGALGWTDGNMPFVFTCVHPAQSHYTTGAAKKIMDAVPDKKRFVEAIIDLSTVVTNDPSILEFSTFFLRQLIVTLSAPKVLMQAFRLVLRFMIDLVRRQQGGASYDAKQDILYPLIRGTIFHYPRDTRNSCGGIDEVFWTSGLIEDILDLIHNEHEEENDKVDERYRLLALTSIFSLTRVVEFRILLRDAKMIDVVIKAYNAANPDRGVCEAWDEKVSDMLMNMSERDEIKTSLKNSDALDILELMIENYPKPEDASRLFSLIALAHIWGSDVVFEDVASDVVMERSHPRLDKVKANLQEIKRDGISATRTRMSASEERDVQMKSESAIAGRLLKDNNLSEWLFEKLLQAMEDGSATIVAAGFTIFLNTEDVIHAIQSISANKEAARNMGLKSPGLYSALIKMLRGDRARDPEDNNREVLIKTLGSILNFTDVRELCQAMEDEGKKAEIEEVLEAMDEKEEVADQRIKDLIKGVLANLRGQAYTAEAVLNKIDKAGEGDEVLFDVFLSHKRTDAKDFCRGLYNLLQADGIECFLDFEFREELSRLEEIVARCNNFIFVLSDNVFDSPWCIKELQAAVAKKKNIVLVTKDGSRWKDANGSNTCHFPPHEIISKLPLDVQKAFDSKAIGHSDEYYQAFKDQLLRRLKRMGTPQQNGGRLQNRQSWSGGGLHGSSSFQALAPGIDSAVINEVVVSSERSLSTKIISTERTLRDQIDVSEQAITKKLRAHGQDIAELVQSIENRLNTKLEARMREIKEELVASTQGIKEVISDLKLSTSFGGGGGQGVSDGGGGGGGSPLSPGGARPSTALSRSTDNHQTSAFASHPNTSTTAAINTASSQLQVYNGSPSSLLPPTSSSSSSSPMAARISRPMSGRPHTGSPTVYQIPQQGRGSITMGGSMSIKGLTNKTSSPRI